MKFYLLRAERQGTILPTLLDESTTKQVGQVGKGGRGIAALSVSALVFAALGAIAVAPNAEASPGAAPTVASAAPALPATPVCATATPGRATCMSVINSVQPATVNKRLNAASPATALPSGYGPADLASAYNLDPAKGAGQTVAIVDAGGSSTVEADLATYRATYGLSACTTANGCFQQVNQTGTTSPLPAEFSNWPTEIALDVDMVSAACPLCKILLVSTDDNTFLSLGIGVDTAVALGAKFVSNSYGGADTADTHSYEVHYNHPGVAVTVSTGDYGYATAYPAASKYVTAVGGTTLSRDTTAARGWGESAWSGSGSGCSVNNTQLPAQASVGTGCSTRAIADVSAVAQGLAVNRGGSWITVGGTSASAPIVASVYALAGTPWTTDYPNSYPYAHPSGFYDVSTGNSGSCPTVQWCTAGTGWDGPTGLGSPNGSSAFVLPTRAPVINDLGATTYNATIESVLGHANTFGDATVKSTFQWGTTTAYGNSVPTAAVATGFSSNFGGSFSGVTAGVTYHYRAILFNSARVVFGPDKTFIAGAPNITNASEFSPGIGKANFLVQATSLTPTVTATLKWGTTSAYGTSVAKAATGTLSGSRYTFAVVWSGLITGLTPGVTYHYAYDVTNSYGTTTSVDQTFIAVGAPVITSAVGASTGAATASFSVAANLFADSTATASVSWGETAAYGTTIPQPLAIVLSTGGYTATGTLPVAVTGLTPGTTYHYSYTLTTTRGTVVSPDQTFVASAGPLITVAVEYSPSTGAANFLVLANTYLESSATAVVMWGTTSAYGSSLTKPMPATLGTDGFYSGAVAFARLVTGLVPGAVYHYAFTVTTIRGTTTSVDQTFVAKS